MPAGEIVPTAEFPPMPPLTSQLTAVLLVPDTVAANCWDWPACKLEAVGDIVTEMRWGWFPLFPLAPWDAGRQKKNRFRKCQSGWGRDSSSIDIPRASSPRQRH